MNTVERSYAKAKFITLLADIARTGESVTITYRGRPMAALTPVHSRPRRFSQLPILAVPVP
jgi:prevent-host-death family protein